ncbi:uncharacterized protein HMPREF1541_02574 [Cyphellophora europaea CBS 101466]|uniref:Life-span regulatory factor domain-containing protein n=1 Tax=Cyphellophora europaea (strain CBS 101466) TaxID=1220924 RepID=W2S4A6_CYPE1|nr:uncharacterized protein HMPREF1541_02574 [Cyphellophora europaea CBS 101466]ETN43415.1 hypothetical protein HMPREF1541_02574 [Cyphellophora europaea CBS 101466]
MAATELFGDFCLSCDRQTNGTTFCSQACRIAELELYTGSESSSSPYNGTRQTYAHRSTASAGSGFQLPPAYDFRRQTSTTSLSTSSSDLSTSPPLSPSKTKLTDQARSDLRDYVGAFDQTRTIRRRVSMQSS